ncbi:hypothetical protein D3C73_1046060 [compost metagenome]
MLAEEYHPQDKERNIQRPLGERRFSPQPGLREYGQAGHPSGSDSVRQEKQIESQPRNQRAQQNQQNIHRMAQGSIEWNKRGFIT